MTLQSPSTSTLSALAAEFAIERELGRGSSAIVYLAREIALDRLVTIKVLHAGLAADPASRLRFEREARAVADLIHPSIAPVLRFGVLPDGAPYLVSRYLHGRTIEDRIAAEGPFDAGTVRILAAQIADALAAAHQHGVVHRDVRPGNIFIDERDGRPVVTDFGIALTTEAWPHGQQVRLTRTGELLGDPRYISPEQFRGEPVTEAADVYSLGLVVYEMLTGARLFAEEGARASLAARLSVKPLRLPTDFARTEPELARLISRCLAAEPRHRPSMAAVARALRGDVRGATAGSLGPSLLPAPLARMRDALAQRRLPQWVAGTAAAGWLLLQVVDQLTDQDVLPAPSYRVGLATLLAAIVGAAVLAWFHGARGEQRFRLIELLILLAVLALWIVGLLAILD